MLALAGAAEEKRLDFAQPRRNWSVWEFLFDDPMKKINQPKSKMIHPRSKFSSYIVIFSSLALSYTTIVVPVVIAFNWHVGDDCTRSPLLEVDLLFDTFFVLEVLLGFLVADFDPKGKLIDEYQQVAKNYAEGHLWFDIVTALPVSYIELWVLEQCDGDRAAGIDPDRWRFARLVKPLRFIRILRVYRALVTVDISYKLEKLLRVQPLFLSIIRVLLGLLVITHLAACTFWLVKQISNDVEEVEAFLVSQGLQTDSHVIRQYVLACYFIITIFTTVGFGDISATNTSEQLVCMVLMTTGVVVFGTLLSEVQSGVAEMRKFSREKGQMIQKLKNYMRMEGVSAAMERRILGWANFDIMVMQQQESMRSAMDRLSDDQRLDLLVHIFGSECQGIDLLDLEHHAAQDMQAYVWAAAETFVFEEGHVISQPGESVTSMLVINKGLVRVEDTEGNELVVLGKGDAIGAWSLMGDTDAWSQYGVPAIFKATTHVHAYVISKSAFQEVLSVCPRELIDEVEDKYKHHQKDREQKELLRTQTAPFRRAVAKWEAIVHKVLKKKGPRHSNSRTGHSSRSGKGVLMHGHSYKKHGQSSQSVSLSTFDPMTGQKHQGSHSNTYQGALQIAAVFGQAVSQVQKEKKEQSEQEAQSKKEKASSRNQDKHETIVTPPTTSGGVIGAAHNTGLGSGRHITGGIGKGLGSGSGRGSKSPRRLRGVEGQHLPSGNTEKPLDVLSISADITYGDQADRMPDPRRTTSEGSTSSIQDVNGLLGPRPSSDGDRSIEDLASLASDEMECLVRGGSSGDDSEDQRPNPVIDGLRSIDLLSSMSIRPTHDPGLIPMAGSPLFLDNEITRVSSADFPAAHKEHTEDSFRRQRQPEPLSSFPMTDIEPSLGPPELSTPRHQEVQSSLTPRPTSAVVVSQNGPLVSIGDRLCEGAGWRGPNHLEPSKSPTPSDDAFLEGVPGLEDGCRSPLLPPPLPPRSMSPQDKDQKTAQQVRMQVDEVIQLQSIGPVGSGLNRRSPQAQPRRLPSGSTTGATNLEAEVAWVRKDVARIENRVSHMDSHVDQLQEDMARMLSMVEEIHVAMTAMTGVGSEKPRRASAARGAGAAFGATPTPFGSIRNHNQLASIGMGGGRPLGSLGLARQATLASIGGSRGGALSSIPLMRKQANAPPARNGNNTEEKGGPWAKLRAAVSQARH